MRKPTNRVLFSQKAIAKLPVPDTGRVHYYDKNVRDLGLRVEANGRKTFFWFRKVRGRPTWKTIGIFPATSVDQARGKAHELSGQLDKLKRDDYQGKNPFERSPGEPTLEVLFEDYLSKHLKRFAKRPQDAEARVRWMFHAYLNRLAARKVGMIRRKDILDLHAGLGQEHGHTTANRVVQLLRTMYNFAVSAETWKGENPAAKVKLFYETARTRFLAADELARLFTALRSEPSKDLKDFVLLCLLSGARKSDVLSMAWRDVSLADNKWTVPSPKNRKPYIIALVPEAVDLLKKRQNDSMWVFPSVGKTGHVVDLKGRWKLLIRRAGISDLHVHDLRRTLGSWQAAQGTSLKIIGASLGHESVEATAVYSQLDLAPIRASVTAATTAMLQAGKQKPKLLAAPRG